MTIDHAATEVAAEAHIAYVGTLDAPDKIEWAFCELAYAYLAQSEALEIAHAALVGIVSNEAYRGWLDRGVAADAVQDDFERCEDALVAIDVAMRGEGGQP